MAPSDNEEADLVRAIAMSLEENNPQAPSVRERSISPPPLSKKRRVGDSPLSSPQISESPFYDRSSVQYPQGVIRKTWAFGHARKNDIKIEEVLQKRTLNIAVLSAFDWDVDWLLDKLNTAKTKMIWIMEAKTPKIAQQYREESSDIPNLRLVFPDMSGQINCMHSKLMLLFHDTHLRIVLPSANLNRHDWGESGMMENSAFLIDLPRLPHAIPNAMTELPDFGKDLLHFIRAQGVGTDVQNGLLKFDWYRTRQFAFVHTIGGSHVGDHLERTGMRGLSRAIGQLNLRSDSSSLELDFTASSIGSLNDQFLKNLYLSASGKGPQATVSRPVPDRLRDRIRVYFPLHDTVAYSKGGVNAAGTNCLQSGFYNNPKFPREIMRDYKSARPGLLSHNKVIFGRGSDRQSEFPHSTAWLYVGSANCSESAWGKLFVDRKQTEKMNCRNWECGVLVPVPRERLQAVEDINGKVPDMNIFEGVADVPFEYPGEEYRDKRPWFFMEPR